MSDPLTTRAARDWREERDGARAPPPALAGRSACSGS